MGKITSWHDPLLKPDNPGEKLPHQKITVVHRADGSGTTEAFTTYLSAVSPVWSQTVGKGTSVKWPTGLGAKGSEGVTGQVKQSPGSIGYVELTYATQNNLPVAAMKNRGGQVVLPFRQERQRRSMPSRMSWLRTIAPPSPIRPPCASCLSDLDSTFLIIPKDGIDSETDRTEAIRALHGETAKGRPGLTTPPCQTR